MVLPRFSTCTEVIPWCVRGTREHRVHHLEHDSGDNTSRGTTTVLLLVCLQRRWTQTRARRRPRVTHTHAHSHTHTHAHKHTHRRTERGDNANNVGVRVSAALLCVRHYPIILSGAAAAQVGILTTASGPTCTATRDHAADAAPRSSGRRRSDRKLWD